jgi:hypothetical protein
VSVIQDLLAILAIRDLLVMLDRSVIQETTESADQAEQVVTVVRQVIRDLLAMLAMLDNMLVLVAAGAGAQEIPAKK